MAKAAPIDIDELFETARELFGAEKQEARDTAFFFFRDVWQLNRIWRAIHDKRNPAREAQVAAELLGLHANTVTNKLKQLGLSAKHLKKSTSVSQLIQQSPSLRETARDLKRMRTAERRRSKHLIRSV